MINERSRRGHWVGFVFGWGAVRSGTAAGGWTNLDNRNLLFRVTPGKVMVQRNVGNAVPTVWIAPLSQSVP